MSTTPRTDAAMKWAYPQGNYVSLRDCRFIERELNLAMSQLEKMDKRIKLFKKCIRLRDTELKKLRRSIHAAHGLLSPLGNQINPSVLAIREALDILRRA